VSSEASREAAPLTAGPRRLPHRLRPEPPPIALISESGGRREDRQKKVLEGWRDAVYAGQYAAVLYDCANDSVAHWISRLAAKARLTRSEFTVVIQARAEEIGTLAPAADKDVPPASTSDTNMPSSSEVKIEPVRTPAPAVRVPAVQPAEPPKQPDPKTPEEAAERERRYREIFGIAEPRSRRRWRRAR
jgi:hypothetical protein